MMLLIDLPERPVTTNELRTAPSAFSRAVGEQLRLVLEAKGMTQRELADLSGFPRPIINQIVNGKQNTSIARLEYLFGCLGYELEVTARESRPALRRSQKRAREGLL